MIRQRAVLLLAVSASNPNATLEEICESFYGELDIRAIDLAARAWIAVDGAELDLEGPNDPRRDLEAVEMLLEGWT